ncbi:MAG: DNA-processing protein DprA [Actinomycetota bacterium]
MGVGTGLFSRVYRENNLDLSKTLKCFLKKPLPIKNGRLERILESMEENGIKVLNIADKRYPRALKHIGTIAPVLFYKGEKILKDMPRIAVVGTRNATAYGRQAADYFGRQLSGAKITVISGMAKGIDGYAQKAALKKEGGTIGVLGCGLCHIYPKSNLSLYGDILKNGSMVSEYLPWEPPQKKNFPQRNRIISGLSSGVVVIESDSRGGALITAGFALDQGREVFAVPGNIFSRSSRGTNHLIKQGAKLVTGIDDVLNEISCLWA